MAKLKRVRSSRDESAAAAALEALTQMAGKLGEGINNSNAEENLVRTIYWNQSFVYLRKQIVLLVNNLFCFLSLYLDITALLNLTLKIKIILAYYDAQAISKLCTSFETSLNLIHEEKFFPSSSSALPSFVPVPVAQWARSLKPWRRSSVVTWPPTGWWAGLTGNDSNLKSNFNFRKTEQGSISPTFYVQLLRSMIIKVLKLSWLYSFLQFEIVSSF